MSIVWVFEVSVSLDDVRVQPTWRFFCLGLAEGLESEGFHLTQVFCRPDLTYPGKDRDWKWGGELCSTALSEAQVHLAARPAAESMLAVTEQVPVARHMGKS